MGQCVSVPFHPSITSPQVPIIVGWEEYARTLHAFLTGLGTGVDVDFSTRRLVGIGHSMGAVCLCVKPLLPPHYYLTVKPLPQGCSRSVTLQLSSSNR